MKNGLLKAMYDCFYIPPELPATKQEIEDCHRALIDCLEKPECRLVLQIIDAKDRIAEETAIDRWKELGRSVNVSLTNCSQTGELFQGVLIEIQMANTLPTILAYSVQREYIGLPSSYLFHA